MALISLEKQCLGLFRGFFVALSWPSFWANFTRSHPRKVFRSLNLIKNLLTPLFLMGCFPVDFQEGKRPLRTKSVKRPIKVGKRPINEGKRPIKAMVLVGISVGCLMGCFRAPPPWRKTAPLKRPIKRSMTLVAFHCGCKLASDFAVATPPAAPSCNEVYYVAPIGAFFCTSVSPINGH